MILQQFLEESNYGWSTNFRVFFGVENSFNLSCNKRKLVYFTYTMLFIHLKISSLLAIAVYLCPFVCLFLYMVAYFTLNLHINIIISHVDIIVLHVDMIMFRVDIIMLQADVNKLHV